MVITALPIEYQSVRRHLSDCETIVHEKGTIYERGLHSTAEFDWKVAVTEVGAGGPRAAIETERAIQQFSPDIVFFVGVAGGVKDVDIGDVVVGSKIYVYESGAETKKFQPRPEAVEPSHVMLQRARYEAKRDEWRRYLTSEYVVPPKVLIGAIAAGEKVIKSRRSPSAQLLKGSYNDVLAVEMEGHGFLEAAHANNSNALVLRGISDLLSGKARSDRAGSQRLAAERAAAFMFACIDGLSKTQTGRVPEYIHLGASLLPFRFDLLEQRVTLTIQDDAGRNVRYEKQSRLRTIAERAHTYADDLNADGSIVECSVDPGDVEYVVKKKSQYAILTRMPIAPQPGKVFDRKLSCTFIDSFGNNEEWWNAGPPHPSDVSEFTLKFPPTRCGKRVWIEGTNVEATTETNGNGGIAQARWIIQNPEANGRFTLRWEW